MGNRRIRLIVRNFLGDHMKKQGFVVLGAGVVLAAVLVWLVWGNPAEEVKSQGAAPHAPVPVVGSPGSFFGASPQAPSPAVADPAKIAADAQSDVDRLWPHVRKGEPSAEEHAKIRVQWVNFAVKYPENIYIPNEFKPPLSGAEQTAVRQQLDDTTAMVAKQAAQKRMERFAQPSAGGSVGAFAQGQIGAAPVVTELQARDSGITPEQQRNYFNYKIKELESRIQLVEFYLSSDDLGASKKTAAQKELIVWKKELEELVRVKAQVPNS